LPQRNVGIRPGDNLHEVMCPSDDSHLTLDFGNHYMIRPSIRMFDQSNDYSMNKMAETGHPVKRGFEYCSATNERFLSVDEICEFNQRAGLD
jgi:UDP-N-acetylglucosamine 4,6-dehydratase